MELLESTGAEPKETPPSQGAIRSVLVVDDSKAQRRILSASLKRWGFEVREAAGGAEALELCAEQAPDLVLSDWMMPEMDGLEFCREFRNQPSDFYSYFILLTSKNDKGAIAQGLDCGADDFLNKPVDSAELRARIHAGERIMKMQRELNSQNKLVTETLSELRGLYDVIDKDLIQAKKIQESLMPERVREFGKSRVSLLMKPCGHVGGDLVGIFSPGKGRIGFYSIDVSGHGITSALMTARVSGYLSSDFPDQNIAMERRFEKFFAMREPDEVAYLLNERLSVDAGVVEYFTMAYCNVDLVNGYCRLVQAGHPHPLLIRADGRLDYLGAGGVPIGLVPDVSYSAVTQKLEPGDRLLLYSDGITECTMKSGEMLEEDGLKDLVRLSLDARNGQEFLDDLFWNLSQDMENPGVFDDDVSAALLEFNGE